MSPKQQNCPFNDIPKELAEKWRNRLEEIGKEEPLQVTPLTIPEFEIPIIAPDGPPDRELCTHAPTVEHVERTKIRMAGLVTICKWFSVTGATVYLVHKGLLEAIAWFVRR